MLRPRVYDKHPDETRGVFESLLPIINPHLPAQPTQSAESTPPSPQNHPTHTHTHSKPLAPIELGRGRTAGNAPHASLHGNSGSSTQTRHKTHTISSVLMHDLPGRCGIIIHYHLLKYHLIIERRLLLASYATLRKHQDPWK